VPSGATTPPGLAQIFASGWGTGANGCYIITAEKDCFCPYSQLSDWIEFVLTDARDRIRPELQPKERAVHSAGLSAQERVFIDHFAASEKATITSADALEVQPLSQAHANKVLSRLAAKGWLVRVGRGVYTVVRLGTVTPEAAIDDPLALAMSLFSPCYISGWTAAEHWDLTEQIFNSVVVMTTKPQRKHQRDVAGVRFVLRVIDERKMFGIARVWSGSRRVDIAEPHRLIVDILAAPEIGGGARHTLDVVRSYFNSKHCNLDKLLDYAEQYDKGVVFKRLGFCAEHFDKAPQAWLERCRNHMSAGLSLLDPSGPKRGRIVSRWGLRINVPVGDE
jgi:predicted transcriptional regulator of viral defense system